MDKKKQCILVVDDHPKVRKFVEIDLKLRGFKVICASCGEEALELVKSDKPDIVLLDVVMPGMNGFEVIKALRAFTQLPIITFSASPVNRESAIRLGANYFMPKPFDPGLMANKIRSLLNSPGN